MKRKLVNSLIILLFCSLVIIPKLTASTSLVKVICDSFSGINVTFSGISVYNSDNDEWVTVSDTAKTADLEFAAVTGLSLIINGRNIPTGNYSKVRYVISDVSGSLNGTEQIVFEITNGTIEKDFSFTIGTNEQVLLNAKFDLYESIKPNASGYEFNPVIYSIGCEKQDINFYWAMQNTNDIAPNIGTGNITKVNPDNGPIVSTIGVSGLGNAIQFQTGWNTNRAYYSVDPSNINPDKGIIDFWYRPDYSTSTGVGMYFFYSTGSANSSFYFIKSGNSGDPLQFFVDSANSVYTQIPGYTWLAQKDRWYYFKLIWDKQNQKAEIWIDGVKRSGSVNNASNWQAVTFSGFSIGNKMPESSYGMVKGALDEFTSYCPLAPDAVNNLQATTGANSGQVDLAWTSTGSNGNSGTLTTGKYYVRYSTYNSDLQDTVYWQVSKAQIIISTANVNPGETQKVTLSKLPRGVTYYFTLWTEDEEQNISNISNITESPAQNLNEQYLYWDMENMKDEAPNIGAGCITYINPDNGPIVNVTGAPNTTGKGIYIPSEWNTKKAYFGVDPTNINPEKGSIEFWYKPNYTGSPSSWKYLFFGSCTANTSFYGYVSGNPSYPMGFMLDSANGVKVETSGWQAVADTWYQVKYVWDRNIQKAEIWINGEKKSGTVSYPGNWQQETFYKFAIGNKIPESSYGSTGGTLDEFYIYRSTDEQRGIMKVRKSFAPDSTFRLGDVYAYPNPAKNGANSIIHIECGIADKVEINVYNIAGEKIAQQQLDASSPQIINNTYCYEYTLEANTVASGVYIYYILAEKSGEVPIKVIKKLALIR